MEAFHDGNFDIEWKRGVVFTAKEDGLWTPIPKVSAEDIHHIRNRVMEFRFQHAFSSENLKDVTSCAPCMARWICDGAAAHDAAEALRCIPVSEPAPRVTGFGELMNAAQISAQAAQALLKDLRAAGAVRVKELETPDWEAMPAWVLLKPG